MTPETIGTEIALMRVYDAMRKAHGHDVVQMLASIPQDVAAQVCPDCQAEPGQPCHVDCMSRWDDGGLS